MPNWTEDQLQAIHLKDKNLIISAAAGSGKTAVLIERIFCIIKEGKTNVNNILMITFTRKAASEMKEKLQKKLDLEIELNPDDTNLRKQRNLLEASDIKTIDSFCLQVVKNQFNELDLDLKFQILDEKRNNELKTVILDKIFEEEYRMANPLFYQLVEIYGKLESDEDFRNNIIALYDFSQSNPDPSIWLENSLLSYVPDTKGFEETEIGNYYKNVIIERELKNLERYLNIMEDCVADGAPEYEKVCQDDREQFNIMINELHINGIAEFLKYTPNPKRMPSVKADNKNECHNIFITLRKDFKDKLKELTVDLEEKLSQQSEAKAQTEYLISLVDKLYTALMEEKRRLNLFDYNDVEHLALYLLKKPEFSQRYKEYYEYIFIDEYQDTNGVQEEIFNLISRTNNMFYVGDLKQSIYRFRLADSSIFKGKVNEYETDQNSHALTLNKNFRSSQSVVNGVNSLFNHLMDGFISPVKYREEAQLVHGSSILNKNSIQTYIVDLDDSNQLDEEDSDELYIKDKIYKEAEICARKIREMVDSKDYKYKDFTILANSIKFIVDPYKEIFDMYSIPLYGDIDTGFLKSLSVGFIIDYLEIIDNINNDLSLINILKSPIYNFSLEELGIIRLERSKDEYVITSLENYLKKENGLLSIKSKIQYFLENIISIKKRVNEQNLIDFTIQLLIDSKYYFTIFNKDDDEQESLNVKELLRLITEFEMEDNSHLSGFLRYFRHIQKNEICLPSSSLISEEDDVVRMQTIHKSKGLEYENVFLVKLGDWWRNPTVNQLNYHQKLGIGAKFIRHNDKKKMKTLNYDIIGKALEYENLEDKLNLLYVAMTRAKNNLFLVGSVKKLDKLQSSIFDNVSKPKSLYDLILPLILNNDEVKGSFEVFIENGIINKGNIKRKAILQVSDCEYRGNVKTRNIEQLPKKLSATDFVKLNSIEKALTRDLLRNSLKIKPDFLQDKKITSVEKGIIYHLVMELLDFSREYTKEDLEIELAKFVDKGIFSTKEAESLDLDGIMGFFTSTIYKKLQEASYYEKEKPFNLNVNPALIGQDYSGDDKILVQGIIDLYFVEDENCTLIDYKTDYVEQENLEEKLEEYKKQLMLYKMALEDIKHLKVNEAYLYFSNIREFVRIEFGG